MEAKIEVPNEFLGIFDEPLEKYMLELIAVGLYREGKITLRQAAEMLGVDYQGMMGLLRKHNSYVNYDIEELKEDITYARGK